MDLQQLIVTGSVLALFALLMAGYLAARPLIRQKVGAAEFDRLVKMAEVQVHNLEQIGERLGYDGAKKKQMVKVILMQFAAAVGLKVNEELVEDVIEACVFAMNLKKPVAE